VSDDLELTTVSPEEAERAAWRQVAEQCFAAWSKAPEHEKKSHLLTGPALAWAELELLANTDHHTLRYRLFLTQSLSYEDRAAEMPSLSAVAATPEGRRLTIGLVVSMVTAAVVLAPLMYFAAERLAIRRSAPQLAQSEPVVPAITEMNAGSRPPGLVTDGDREPGQHDPLPIQVGETPVSPTNPEPGVPNAVIVEPTTIPAEIDPGHGIKLERDRLRTHLLRLAAWEGEALSFQSQPVRVPDAAIELAEGMLSQPSTDSRIKLDRLSELASIFATRVPLQAADGPGRLQRTIEGQFCKGEQKAIGRTGGREIVVWNTRSGRPFTSARLDQWTGRLIALDSRCSQLLYDAEDYNIETVALTTGDKIAIFSGHEASLTGFAYSPDGRSVLAASRDGTARLWDARTAAVLTELRGHEGPLVGAAYDPKGTRVVTWAEDRSARIWDARSGRQIGILEQHNGIVTSAQFTTSGTHVVTTSVDGFVRVWDTRTGDVSTLRATGASIVNAVVSHDDRLIAVTTQSSTVEIWSLPTASFLARLEGTAEPLRKLAFSLDSEQLITLSWQGRLAFWGTRSGQILLELRQNGSIASDFAFDPTHQFTRAILTDGTIVTWPTYAALTGALEAARISH
jgi:WD40 repeat protein